MDKADRFTLAEVQRKFAIALHNTTWQLREKAGHTPEEQEQMVHAAHASCYHWLQAGTAVHHPHATWLLARGYATLGDGPQALRHARRCHELTAQHADLLADFDHAYAYEALGRANIVLGDAEQGRHYVQLARQAGQVIADREDRALFLGELEGGDWRGVEPTAT